MATKAIVGEKLGMTQVWDEQNRAIPVTVVKVAPCRVVQVKTPEHDGYSAVQVTFGMIQAKRLSKPRRVTSPRPASRRGGIWSSCGSTTRATTRWARRSRSTCSPRAITST